MRHAAIQLLIAVSLAMWLGTAVLFIRTFFKEDVCQVALPGTTHGLVMNRWSSIAESGKGVVSVSLKRESRTASDQQDLAQWRDIYEDPSPRWYHTADDPDKPSPSRYQLVDFGFSPLRMTDPPMVDNGLEIRIPLWFLLVVCGCGPALWMRRRIFGHKARPGCGSFEQPTAA